MKHRGLFKMSRLFIRPWVSRFKPVWFVQALSLSLDFILGFLAPIGFRKIKISDNLNAATIVTGALGDRPVILYLHGGAFCVHLPNAYRSLCRKLSKVCDADIIMPDYRLAPKHKFPAGLNDCVVAYEHLLDSGVKPEQIAIMGDSAGGNFTFATMAEIIRKQLPMPSCAVALSPIVDMNAETDSAQNNADTEFYFSAKTIEPLRAAYLTGSESMDDPRLSPIYADLSKLPPVLLHACYGEMLEHDAVNMHKAINDAGGDATLKMWADVPHVFHMIAGLPETREALTDIGLFAKAQFTA